MKKHILYYCLFLSIYLFACTSQGKQEKHQTISYKHRVFVHSDSCILGKPNQIALSGSYLAITDLNNDKVLYVFNSQTGKKVGEYVNRGQGPGEYYSISSLGRWKDGMYLYDVNKREMAEIAFKDSVRIIPRMSFGRELHPTFVPLNDDTFIASGFYPEGRFCLIKDSGKQKEYIMEYPSRDDAEKEVTNFAKSQAYSGGIVAHPSGSLFMAHVSKADMLSFYSYENGNVRLIKEMLNSFPDYEYDKENQRYLAISRQNPFTHLWGCGTEKYVYLLYSGKSYAEAGERAFLSSRIEVYNWEGEKVKTLMLDIPIQGMVVSEDDSTMYAIALNPEPQIVAFDL